MCRTVSGRARSGAAVRGKLVGLSRQRLHRARAASSPASQPAPTLQPGPSPHEPTSRDRSAFPPTRVSTAALADKRAASPDKRIARALDGCEHINKIGDILASAARQAPTLRIATHALNRAKLLRARRFMYKRRPNRAKQAKDFSACLKAIHAFLARCPAGQPLSACTRFAAAATHLGEPQMEAMLLGRVADLSLPSLTAASEASTSDAIFSPRRVAGVLGTGTDSPASMSWRGAHADAAAPTGVAAEAGQDAGGAAQQRPPVVVMLAAFAGNGAATWVSDEWFGVAAGMVLAEAQSWPVGVVADAMLSYARLQRPCNADAEQVLLQLLQAYLSSHGRRAPAAIRARAALATVLYQRGSPMTPSPLQLCSPELYPGDAAWDPSATLELLEAQTALAHALRAAMASADAESAADGHARAVLKQQTQLKQALAAVNVSKAHLLTMLDAMPVGQVVRAVHLVTAAPVPHQSRIGFACRALALVTAAPISTIIELRPTEWVAFLHASLGVGVHTYRLEPFGVRLLRWLVEDHAPSGDAAELLFALGQLRLDVHHPEVARLVSALLSRMRREKPRPDVHECARAVAGVAGMRRSYQSSIAAKQATALVGEVLHRVGEFSDRELIAFAAAVARLGLAFKCRLALVAVLEQRLTVPVLKGLEPVVRVSVVHALAGLIRVKVPYATLKGSGGRRVEEVPEPDGPDMAGLQVELLLDRACTNISIEDLPVNCLPSLLYSYAQLQVAPSVAMPHLYSTMGVLERDMSWLTDEDVPRLLRGLAQYRYQVQLVPAFLVSMSQRIETAVPVLDSMGLKEVAVFWALLVHVNQRNLAGVQRSAAARGGYMRRLQSGILEALVDRFDYLLPELDVIVALEVSSAIVFIHRVFRVRGRCVSRRFAAGITAYLEAHKDAPPRLQKYLDRMRNLLKFAQVSTRGHVGGHRDTMHRAA